MHSPVDMFKKVWQEARLNGSRQHRKAVCVCTIDAHGYPSSHFVDLEDAEETGFVFRAQLDAAKALDLERNPKAAMTLWWEHVAMQIRIKGTCRPLGQAFNPVAQPANRGGFRLRPQHVEFLEFRETRLHLRTVYALVAGRWHRSLLQP